VLKLYRSAITRRATFLVLVRFLCTPSVCARRRRRLASRAQRALVETGEACVCARRLLLVVNVRVCVRAGHTYDRAEGRARECADPELDICFRSDTSWANVVRISGVSVAHTWAQRVCERRS
jgi:hypothetical protein